MEYRWAVLCRSVKQRHGNAEHRPDGNQGETVLSFLRERQVVEDEQIPRRNCAKSSKCRYCGQEIRYDRPDSAIVPLPLGTATAPH
jgi:hypothetical protein